VSSIIEKQVPDCNLSIGNRFSNIHVETVHLRYRISEVDHNLILPKPDVAEEYPYKN
jgi:hypothetical protein